jgi:hypothetical protein
MNMSFVRATVVTRATLANVGPSRHPRRPRRGAGIHHPDYAGQKILRRRREIPEPIPCPSLRVGAGFRPTSMNETGMAAAAAPADPMSFPRTRESRRPSRSELHPFGSGDSPPTCAAASWPLDTRSREYDKFILVNQHFRHLLLVKRAIQRPL